MDFEKLKELLGKNFIGPNEIERIHKKMNVLSPLLLKEEIPVMPYSIDVLNKYKRTHVLFLGIPYQSNHKNISINSMRSFFGIDPEKNEPCFYNQDWYVKENFANETFTLRWYFIKKELINETRGLDIKSIGKMPEINENFPSAVLIAFFFFLFYFHTNHEILFKHDYVWNSDLDANGDRIYVGKYADPLGINKNGFEIHRHLSIKLNYGSLNLI